MLNNNNNNNNNVIVIGSAIRSSLIFINFIKMFNC